MKEYCSIPGWTKAPLGLPCIAFDKIDGSNIRVEWTKKNGFCKFGSRTVLMDRNHPTLGEAIPLFETTLAQKIDKIFRTEKKMPRFDQAVVFMEFAGPNSMFGQHEPSDPKSLTIIDVNIHKRGFVLPRDFIKWFGDLPIPKVIYEGNFNVSFIKDVREGKYGLDQGVVAKGINPKFKNEQHGLWLAKVKTYAWLYKLEELAEKNASLQRMLEENRKEQIGDYIAHAT